MREFVELLCKKQRGVECGKTAKVEISAHSCGVPREKQPRKLESEVSCDDCVIRRLLISEKVDLHSARRGRKAVHGSSPARAARNKVLTVQAAKAACRPL